MPVPHRMIPAVAPRVLRALCVTAVAGAVTWAVMTALPGDPAVMASRTGDPATVARLRAEMGLDRPFAVRWAQWAAGIATGDGGELLAAGTPTWRAVAGPARNSAALLLLTLPLMWLIGWATGAAAGMRAGSRRDAALSGGAQATLSVPDFALTTLLVVVLAGILRWLPAVSILPPGASPFARPEALIIPVLAIVAPGAAWLQRMVRGAVADAAAQPHVRAARLSGAHPATVLLRDIAPVARGPLAQASAGVVPYAIAGTVVVENVTGYPGAGTLLASLIAGREADAVASITLVLAGVTSTAFLVADLVGGEARKETVR
ncbi:ABC transporter permease [Corynebacterium sp.]|uniref:ABC transporter permease n=1 Tax=Corynebacterium sp. TaxID=1720 RepID=UPI0026DCC2B9|nr:ABC transporter permease [Corynebacterium sp.]MDO4609793.1 ABC transporter permease [Corynebacterium sp.]